MKVSLNYCSQNGGNLHRALYYNRNLNIGPCTDSNLGQSPYGLGLRNLGQGLSPEDESWGFRVWGLRFRV